MPVSLDQIIANASRRVVELRRNRGEIERSAADAGAVPSLRSALMGAAVGVIAEVKRRSPSNGIIQEQLDAAERAELYVASGAAAVSVLTDEVYFGGSMADLRAAAARVSAPVLRKDFILDELQVAEARAAGAAAVLLIVRALSPKRLTSLLAFAQGLGMEALIEVHTAAELDVALRANAEIIGVNSRDLDTLRIDSDAAWRLLSHVPRDRVAVAESGMGSRADILRAAGAGADAVLIGTALSASADPAGLLRELAGIQRHGR